MQPFQPRLMTAPDRRNLSFVLYFPQSVGRRGNKQKAKKKTGEKVKRGKEIERGKKRFKVTALGVFNVHEGRPVWKGSRQNYRDPPRGTLPRDTV